jgi:hypothetical protein
VTFEEARREVHEAIGGLLDEGEIVVAWTLTIDVAGPDDVRYLAHRAGGGHDGQDASMAWTALGMLRASMKCAEKQLQDCTDDFDDEDGDDGSG